MNQKIGQREFRFEFEKSIVPLHDPVNPSEVYKGEPATATLRTMEGQTVTAQVYRLSPFGVEIVIADKGLAHLKAGDCLNLNIKIGRSDCSFEAIKVASIQFSEKRTLFGFRWCSQELSREEGKDRRQSVRWVCSENDLPTGMAQNPARFNEDIYFSIKSISVDGLHMITSFRNKFLLPGMMLEASLSFPCIGQVNATLKIVNVRVESNAGKPSLILGMRFVQKSPPLDEYVGQYVLQFGPGVSVQEIRQAGLKIKSVDSATQYSFVKSPADYHEVLELRHQAYSAVGKADRDADPLVMSDVFDTQSRILMARHGNRTIGSWRVTFHRSDEQNEYDQYVRFPKDFPRRDEILVLSRICTDPQYRGSDLFYGMMRQCLITTLQSKRRYLLGGCSDELLPLYQKIGFVPTGIYFVHGGLNKIKEQIILADSMNIILGKDVDFGIWKKFYSDLARYVE